MLIACFNKHSNKAANKTYLEAYNNNNNNSHINLLYVLLLVVNFKRLN